MSDGDLLKRSARGDETAFLILDGRYRDGGARFVSVAGVLAQKLLRPIDLEHHHSLAETDLISGFQLRPARGAMDFLAHSIAHNPRRALGARTALRTSDR